ARTMRAPQRARWASAARAAGAGARRPVGRSERRAFFAHAAATRTATRDAGLAGEDSCAFPTIPLGMERAMCQRAGDVGRSTGARAIHQPLGALVGKAVD